MKTALAVSLLLLTGCNGLNRLSDANRTYDKTDVTPSGTFKYRGNVGSGKVDWLDFTDYEITSVTLNTAPLQPFKIGDTYDRAGYLLVGTAYVLFVQCKPSDQWEITLHKG